MANLLLVSLTPAALLIPVANLLPVSFTPVANLPLVSTIPAITVAKFAACVDDIGGAPSLTNISPNFQKKIEMTLLLFSETWGKMIHEKNLKQRSSDTVPLMLLSRH